MTKKMLKGMMTRDKKQGCNMDAKKITKDNEKVTMGGGRPQRDG